MKTISILIENSEIAGFKKACFELEIKIIKEENFTQYDKRYDIEYTTEITLFYLGSLTQHLNQSKFSLQ